LDDPSAELDDDRLARLIEEVSRETVQLIVTSLDPELMAFGVPGRRYRIADGIVTPSDI
jgi:recombinational DNA repair ATPase RecF